MIIGTRRYAAFLAMLACSASACAQTAVPAAPVAAAPEAAASGTVESLALRADAAIRQAMADGPFPGVSVAVARDGQIIYARGMGLADRESGAPVTPQTRFPIGSITKPVTCLSTLQLVGQGKVALDAPVGTYLPDLPAPSRDVTIRQLAEHTSGIPNYLENREFPYSNPVDLTREKMLGYFADKPLMFAPGAKFNYSNSDTFLLGLVIEAVTGQSYDRYVADHVFAPFGMAQADFGADPDHASGYLARGGEFAPAPAYDWLAPFSAGAIVSTAQDLVRFSDGLFGNATPEAVRALALSGDALSDGGANAYLQGCLIEGDLDGRRKLSHPGSIYGFSSHFAYYPDDHLTVVVLTNSQGRNFPALTLEHRIARIFLGLPEPDLSGVAFDPAEAAWIAGNYDITTHRLGFDRLGFAAKEGGLYLSFGGVDSGAPPIALIALGAGRYASSIDTEQRFAFSRQPDGTVALSMRYYDGDFPMVKAAQ
ncbi:serine hydrolase domain-containing protein [Stakelama tenebrarum]|uniref:Beta-lactamase family protein n=1 Tax=Stakelama tenebrarum TaxID=2711215 RepID=A0A6G6Y424_9SPHN|nr:serine hydrolase domain-containing protein [Sphingosinithalassobacter tenebrarum]QIG79363.1 beta-lactamase family protein [Sphingosinithalassobacter tenebrarum]